MPRPIIRNEWAAWAVDTAERTARTFVQGFLGAASIDAVTDAVGGLPDTNLGLGAQLAVGAAAGVWAVLTAFAAKPIGAAGSASLLSPTIVVDDAGAPLELDHGVAVGSRDDTVMFDTVAFLQQLDELRRTHAGLAGRVDELDARVDPLPPPAPSTGERALAVVLAIAEDGDASPEVRIDAIRALESIEALTS